MNLLTPSPGTLRKYGLTAESWQTIADRQGHVCAICKAQPDDRRLCIDHHHVDDFHALPTGERARYVRGLLCWVCNITYVAKGITPERARNVVSYLERFEAQ